ncbi:hypothetical protein SAMN04488582_104462 [Mycobacterium sp. 455mf]|jgi:hypothetical protein|nr:hypothetical protein SAMN04488582_104462 [Mycobacterium sp. 455mf]
MTSASSISKPWSCDAVRHGADPAAQSTSAIAPHDRHTTWWWLSPIRDSYRATEPDGWMRRTSAAAVSACNESYTAWWETSGRSLRTERMMVSVSACGCAWTACRTATRGRVTRMSALLSICWKSAVVATDRSLVPFLELVKNKILANSRGTVRARRAPAGVPCRTRTGRRDRPCGARPATRRCAGTSRGTSRPSCGNPWRCTAGHRIPVPGGRVR